MENLDILQALLKKRVATNSESGPQIAPRPILLQVDNNQSSLCRRIADEWRLPERRRRIPLRTFDRIAKDAFCEPPQKLNKSSKDLMRQECLTQSELIEQAGDCKTPVAEIIGGQMCVKYSVINMMPSFFSLLS